MGREDDFRRPPGPQRPSPPPLTADPSRIHAPAPTTKGRDSTMGYADNRRTPKMRQRKRQAKLQLRLKRRAAEVRAQRQSKNPAQAEPTKAKSKAKKDKAKA